MQKLREVNGLRYKEQAIWFLNAFWKSGPNFSEDLGEAENVWSYCNRCIDLDRKGEEGSELDEFQAHRLLEAINETLTVRDMRKVLTEVDVDFNKYVSLTEFLIYKYKVDWRELVNAPQGEQDEAKINEAQRLLDASTASMKQCEEKANAAKASETAAIESERAATAAETAAVKAEKNAEVSEAKAVVAEHDAKEAEESAVHHETVSREVAKAAAASEAAAVELEKQAKAAEKAAIHAEMEGKTAEEVAETAEAEAKATESAAFAAETGARTAEAKAKAAEELEVDLEAQVAGALAELQREEDAFNAKKVELEATGNNADLGVVKRNMAKNELAQLLCTDPLPLQRAKARGAWRIETRCPLG